MATHTTIQLTPGVWTLLNSGGAALGVVSIYPIDLPVIVKGTATADAPTDFDAAHQIFPLSAIVNTTLAALWPGIAAQHVYGFSAEGGKVVVSCI